MVQPVEFLDSVTNMCLSPEPSEGSQDQPSVDILLEIGPHAALQGPIRQILSQPSLKDKSISYLSCLRRGQDAVSTMQSMACCQLESSYPVSLADINFPHGSKGLQVLADLSPYPWNHQKSHWAESRVNKTLRNRKLPVHDLLGTPTLDSNPFARRWRHVVRPSELPWIRDHQVQSSIVYPGAGYICMAIEASRQSHTGSELVTGYQLRRIDIIKALVVPDSTAGVEVQITMTVCGNGALESGWHQFRILSVDQNDDWNLHCEGQIMTVLKAHTADDSTQARGQDDSVLPASDSLPQKIEPHDLYMSLKQTGLNHGPVFQNLTSIQAGSSKSSCEFVIADSAATMPFQFQQDHILHPTTLDSIFQAVYTALPLAGKRQDVAMLPRSIRSLYVSGDITTQPGDTLAIDSSVKSLSAQGFESDATVALACGRGLGSPLLELKGLYCQSLGTSARAVDAEQSKLCFTVVWKPDITLLSSEDMHHLLLMTSQETQAESHVDQTLNDGVEDKSLESAISTVLEHLAHKVPRSQIIEINAGSGDVTKIVLETLALPSHNTTPRLMHYTWVDASAEQVEAGQERFAKYGDFMTFKHVKAEEDFSARDTSPALYDLVVVHIVGNKDDTLSQAQSLVKPGGALLIVDETGEDSLISLPDFEITELNKPSPTRLVLAMRDEDVSHTLPTDLLLVYASTPPSQEWTNQLGTDLANKAHGSIRIVCQSLAKANDVKGRTVIFLDCPSQSVLEEPSIDEFEATRSTLVDAKGVLWVSTGGAMNCEQPDSALHTGLLRTLRCEYPFKKYVSLSLEIGSSTWQISQTQSIAKTFCTAFEHSQSKHAPHELEYAVHDGLINIPRVFGDTAENAGILESVSSPEMMPFFDPSRNVRLGVGMPGFLDSLVFVDDKTTQGLLPPDHIQIRPAAFGLNFRDVMVAMGQLDETRMGFECSGYVEAVGSEAVSRGFKVGDPVYAFLRGYFANTIRVHHTSVAKVPENMDMETAASIPLVFITAYHALHNMAHLGKGEKVLIHSGTGGVGQAAIMLAQLTEADVYVTVGTPEKREFVKSTYGIPDDHIFNSRNASFAKGIMAATKGNGVDVVLNSLAGPLLAATWNCVAPFGRFIEIGKRDLELNNSLEMGPFIRSVSFASLDLITLGEMRGDVVADIFEQVNALLRTGSIKAVSPVTKFSISDAEKGFRTMQAGRHMGKIVLVPSERDLVKTVTRSRKVAFSPDHSYLIVGGLGGIGRSIIKWMVERGARNLILLSRSASSLDEATSTWLECLGKRGVKVLVESCNVADETQLAACLDTVKAQLPPIKGVIQAAMVLRDILFENMTLSDYEAAIKPKVHGSWNLHRLLPADLDFFVMLSSVSGLGGNATQANYAAGATYQDALARHRAAAGQAAVSIDLGMVKGVGVLAGAQGQKTASRLERLGLRGLDEDEVLRIVETSLRPGRQGVGKSQIITGIPPSWVRPDNDGSQEMHATAAFWIRDARFSPLEVSSDEKSHGRVDTSDSLADVLGDANVSDVDAMAALSKSLISKLATMFVVPETDIDATMSLARLEVDSLLAVELRNWVSAAAQADCSVFDILQASSIASLADKLVKKSSLRPATVNGEHSDDLANGVNGDSK